MYLAFWCMTSRICDRHLVFLITHLVFLMNYLAYRIWQLKNLAFFLKRHIQKIYLDNLSALWDRIFAHDIAHHIQSQCIKVKCIPANVPSFRPYFHPSASFFETFRNWITYYTMTINYTPLHPTFVAEASGVDFNNITPEVVEEIKEGMAKVCDKSAVVYQNHWQRESNCTLTEQYGVLVFRKTGLNDKNHVEMSRLFGELDDVKPYNALGRINRLAYDEWGALVSCSHLLWTLPSLQNLTDWKFSGYLTSATWIQKAISFNPLDKEL